MFLHAVDVSRCLGKYHTSVACIKVSNRTQCNLHVVRPDPKASTELTAAACFPLRRMVGLGALRRTTLHIDFEAPWGQAHALVAKQGRRISEAETLWNAVPKVWCLEMVGKYANRCR